MATGTIKVSPRRTSLWTNSGSSMSAGTDINLSSDDYDFLEIEFLRSNSNTTTVYMQRFPKGYNIALCMTMATADSTTNTFIQSRGLIRVSDTKYTAEAGVIARWGGTASTGNFCVPVRIYGIKY